MRLILRAAFLFVLFFAVYFGVERLVVYPLDPREASPSSIGLQGFNASALETPDGKRLVYWHHPAQRGKPTILYLHGNAGNLSNRKLRFERLVKRGYGVVAPAYRGSSGSEGWPREAAIAKDILHFYEELVNGSLLDRSIRPVIYGESIGAAVALRLSVEMAPELAPQALILEAPFTSLRDVGEAMHPALALATGLMQSRWNSLTYAAEIQTPTLILHGRDDPLVPIAQGRAIFEAIPASDKTFFEVPDAGHIDVWKASAQRKLYQFLNRFD